MPELLLLLVWQASTRCGRDTCDRLLLTPMLLTSAQQVHTTRLLDLGGASLSLLLLLLLWW